ncbi:MAG: sigma-70 family RNA polymerase sigma factor [Minwuia sp.]|nr:sigma-70 family RNA polymerase sigma factor [Minwuia sp.]
MDLSPNTLFRETDLAANASHTACPFNDGVITAIPKLRRFAISLTRSTAGADDLLQDTMERAMRARHQFQTGTNLEAWLFTIMRNKFRSDLRQSGRRGQHVDITDVEHLFATSGNQEGRADISDFAMAYATLPSQERDTLYLVGVMGMDYQEASKELDVEIGTVKSRTSRARAKIHRFLDQHR